MIQEPGEILAFVFFGYFPFCKYQTNNLRKENIENSLKYNYEKGENK